MNGIIIAGGFGTRLRPLTNNRPKHLLPVANRPFLEYQVALLRKHGISEIIFATNYHADQIESHFGNGSRFGVRMKYALESEPLGTAGAIRNAANLAPGESVLVLNGDILTDFDLGELVVFHRDRRAEATIALRPVERPHAFGALTVDSDGRITAWHEPTEDEKKRVAENPGPPTGEFDFINAGIYILEPHVLNRIPGGRPVSIERETYPTLLADKAPVFGMSPEGYWMDIGRPEQYLTANAAVLTGAVQTDVSFRQIGEGASIDPTANIDSVSSIGPRVRIRAETSVRRSIILADSVVGSGAELNDLIVDERAAIPDGSRPRRGTVVAAGSILDS